MDERSEPIDPASSPEPSRVAPESHSARIERHLPSIQPVRPKSGDASEDRSTGGAFWNRHKTLINFWLDSALLILFLVIAWELAVLRFAFPKGASERWRLLGHTASDWQDLAFNTFCVFAAGIILHVMLHWQWIVSTIQTRLLHQKATKDDGSHTMIGVIILFVFIHLVAGGILWARWAIIELPH